MAKLITIPKGEYLYRQGDPATAMYLVKSGSLVITRFFLHHEVAHRNHIFADDIVGELSLFDGKHRDHNVKATQDTEVIMIEYATLLHSMAQLPPWAEALMKTLISHIRIVAHHLRVRIDQEVHQEQMSSSKKPAPLNDAG
ncbi:Crp/Fnr family transcriptional regulator [Bdellovibrio sp. NC01]|uniref:Crp/Fnr family transcriptional regulator n=1 Tax=Bdellovibrio sp. NC01 TaxID=2220073 RepID=UPI00115833A1|nr:cyclic nucleotide-binding domain-containing protein [Bdellovibrio sp. NC01]QDK38163.1 hypothetical protein DOE51_11505 [Bdellovibrio sp. NC01]